MKAATRIRCVVSVLVVFAAALGFVVNFMLTDEAGYEMRLRDFQTKRLWRSQGAYSNSASFRRIPFTPTAPIPDEFSVTRDTAIPSRDGSVQIPLRVWTPTPKVIREMQQKHSIAGESPRLPVVVYIHGGGLCFGHGNDAARDGIGRRFAREGFILVNVDYRLAPENKFPAAIHDVDDAVMWVLRGGLGNGVDLAKVVVMGDSAGGFLTASAAMLARDRRHNGTAAANGEAEIRKVVLLYPWMPLARDTESRAALKDALVIDSEVIQWFLDSFIPKELLESVVSNPWTHAMVHPFASPLGFAGMPETVVFTCGLCPLQDEGAMYAEALRAANVSVTHKHIRGCVHGHLTMPTAPHTEEAWSFILSQLH